MIVGNIVVDSSSCNQFQKVWVHIYWFAENTNTMERYRDVASILGDSHLPLRRSMGLLDDAHRNPDLHGQDTEFQHKIGKVSAVKAEFPNTIDIYLQNSTLSALPYLVYWLLSLVMSPLADYLIVNKHTTVGASRKILNSIGEIPIS